MRYPRPRFLRTALLMLAASTPWSLASAATWGYERVAGPVEFCGKVIPFLEESSRVSQGGFEVLGTPRQESLPAPLEGKLLEDFDFDNDGKPDQVGLHVGWTR